MGKKLLKFPLLLPFGALIFAHIIWGANTVIVKITLQEFPIMSLNFFRFTLATALLIPFLLHLPKKYLHIESADLPRILLGSFLLVPATIGLGYQGLKLTSAIDASVLGFFIPLFSILAGWLFLKEHVYWINLLGLMAGLAGAIIILGLPLILFGSFTGGNLLGNMLILASCITFVAGTIVTKEVLEKYPTVVLTAIAFGIGIISFFLPAAQEYIQDPIWMTKITILGIMGFLFITILSSVCAFFLMEWGLRRVDVVKANLFQYVEPAVAASFAVPILGERISYSFIIGTVLVVLGVYWGTLGKPYHHLLHKRHHKTVFIHERILPKRDSLSQTKSS